MAANEKTPASSESPSPAAPKKERQVAVIVRPGHSIQSGRQMFGPGSTVEVGYGEVQTLIDAGVIEVPK